MTNSSIFLKHVNNGYTNFLNAEKESTKIARTGIFLCQNGKVELTLDGKDYNVQAHSLLTYFAFSELKINKRSSDLKGIIIGGDLEAIQPLLYKISDFNGLFSIRNNPYVELSDEQEKCMLMYTSLIEDIVNRLKGITDSKLETQAQVREMRLIQLELLANSLMINIVSYHASFAHQKKIINRKENVLIKFIASLYKNYRVEHEVSFYSDEQFLTSRYFSAIIKEKSGKTPSQWIATALLVDAKNKLRQTTMTIRDISEDLFFPNQSYFGKWFKNLTGISPLEFKNGKDETKQVEDEFTNLIRRGENFVNPFDEIKPSADI